MEKKIKNISFKIEEELLQKFHFVCKYEGRNAKGQLLYYINSLVRDFEKEHGKITPEDMEQF